MKFSRADKITIYSDNILHKYAPKIITVKSSGDVYVNNGEKSDPRHSNVSHFGSREGELCYISGELLDEIGIDDGSGFNVRIIDNKIVIWLGKWTDIETDLENTRVEIN